jgi:hypothetical protein
MGDWGGAGGFLLFLFLVGDGGGAKGMVIVEGE